MALAVLFRAQTSRFDDAHNRLGKPLIGSWHRIRHSGTAETRINSDRLNRRDSAQPIIRSVWQSPAYALNVR